MKSFLTAAACAAALLASSLPSAAADITGLIGNIDLLGRTVTLTNGVTYRVPQSTRPESLRIGDGVTIDYRADLNGLLVARTMTFNSRSWTWKPQGGSSTVGL
jgi:hypothetical protein